MDLQARRQLREDAIDEHAQLRGWSAGPVDERHGELLVRAVLEHGLELSPSDQVRHHELGPIALALIKRSVPLDAALLAGPAEEPVAASIDPDSVPPDNAALGHEAVRNLGR